MTFHCRHLPPSPHDAIKFIRALNHSASLHRIRDRLSSGKVMKCIHLFRGGPLRFWLVHFYLGRAREFPSWARQPPSTKNDFMIRRCEIKVSVIVLSRNLQLFDVWLSCCIIFPFSLLFPTQHCFATPSSQEAYRAIKSQVSKSHLYL